MYIFVSMFVAGASVVKCVRVEGTTSHRSVHITDLLQDHVLGLSLQNRDMCGPVDISWETVK